MGHIRSNVRLLAAILLVSSSFCCDQVSRTTHYKKCEIANLSFQIPIDATFSKKTGIDVDVFEIKLADSSKLLIQYGEKVFSLFQAPPVVLDVYEKEIVLRNSKYPIEPGSIFFSETPEEDIKENTFSPNYYFYDTLNGIACKVVKPKILGKGITGLYVRNIFKNNSISMYGFDLDSTSNEIAFRIFKSIQKEKLATSN